MARFNAIQNPLVSHVDFGLYYENVGEICVPTLTNSTKMRKQVFPEYFLSIYREIQTAEVFEDDVWVVSHPKNGTTWVQEMVWLLSNNLNYSEAKAKKINGERYILPE